YAGKAVLHRQVEFAQYASLGCRNLAAEFGMTVSMSRRANAWGNVRMESSFKTLKVGARHFYLAERGAAEFLDWAMSSARDSPGTQSD
ncbi:TPA: hypothetical protein ACT5CR_002291, partial [Burkholderia cenocepacia]